MPTLTLDNVRKVFGTTTAVRDLSLKVDQGELVVIVGPSGCGKSTTLRLIAGLEIPTSGEVLIDGKLVTRLSPRKRDVAMVFQSYALYPHMTARGNLAFPLKMQRTPKEEISRRVAQTAELLGMNHILDRKPAQLSGGECQRVALGRAIIREPRIFLLDEPLSNLDTRRRVATRIELKTLHKRLAVTTIHVTHDQEEAMALADRLVVMHQGSIQQTGSPMEVYSRPANRFVASFIGSPAMNLFEGRLLEQDNKLHFEPQGGSEPHGGSSPRISLSHPRFSPCKGMGGREVVLGLRPTDLRPCEASGGGHEAISLRIESVDPLGERMDLRGHWAKDPIVVRVSFDARSRAGDQASFAVDMDRVHLFEPGAFGKGLPIDPPTTHQD